MLADPIVVQYPGTPGGPSSYHLVSLTGTESTRLVDSHTEEETETLRIRTSQSGKAGNIVHRRNAVFNHVWTDTAGAEKFASASLTFSASRGLGTDAELVAFHQFVRLISFLLPDIPALDEVVLSDEFRKFYRGEL